MGKIYVLLAFLILSLAGCKRESDLPEIAPNQFSKEQRESLGEFLTLSIFDQPALYPIRPVNTLKDSILYAYLQWHYDQVNFRFQFNNDDIKNDSWSTQENWKVYIVEDTENTFSFTLPGGTSFISLAMLNALSGAEELYATLALESVRMTSRFQFYKLIELFGSQRLLEITRKGIAPDGTNASDILSELRTAQYDQEVVHILDQMTIEHICQSSIFSPLGLLNQENSFRMLNLDWIERKSTPNRRSFIINTIETSFERCGNRFDQGDYKKYVLDNI